MDDYTKAATFFVEDHSLGLQPLAEVDIKSVWHACMRYADGNLRLLQAIYGQEPSTASAFAALLRQQPLSATGRALFRIADKLSEISVGWAVIYSNPKASASSSSRESAVFTPLKGVCAVERNMESTFLLWSYAIMVQEYDSIDTHMVPEPAFGLPDTMYSFDLKDIVKRHLLVKKTATAKVYRMDPQ